MADQQYKPPVKLSELCWVFWKDHSRDQTVDKDAQIPPREQCWSIGWLLKENSEAIWLAYTTCTTGQIDILQIGKADIVEIRPAIKPRKAKEK